MKNFRIPGRLRLARRKIKRPLRFIGKHPYIYGTILFVFVLAVAFTLPSSENHNNSQEVTLNQYKTVSIAALDSARTDAEKRGRKLKTLDLTKKAPPILDETTSTSMEQ